MESTVWVGRVKSTCSPSLLKETFGKVGRVAKVETGFAGFAFVEFEHVEDAYKACETMKQASIPGIGDILVSKASCRGYDDACKKRDEFWRSRNGVSGPPVLGHGRRWRSPHSQGDRRARSSCSASRRRSRSRPRRSRSRQRSRSKRSLSARPARGSPSVRRTTPPRGSWSGSASRSQSHSRPRCRGRTKPQRRAPKRRPRSRDRSPSAAQSPGKRQEPDSAAERGSASCSEAKDQATGEGAALEEEEEERIVEWSAGETNVAVWTEEEGSGLLSPAQRGAAVSFFDGADVCDLLLEGAAAARARDAAPAVLDGFPHGFQDLSREGARSLLSVLSGFICGEGDLEEADRGSGTERTAESRQKLMIDANGRRIMCKTLLIDGKAVSSAEEAL